jgi:hypothetical protein
LFSCRFGAAPVLSGVCGCNGVSAIVVDGEVDYCQEGKEEGKGEEGKRGIATAHSFHTL